MQRSLGARSEFEAKASYVWGAVLKNLIPLIVAVPGLVAVAMLPDLEDGDMALPALVNHLLPVGLRGLFVAAFLAALMSSIDSYLNSAATIVSYDLYKRFIDRDVSDERLLTIGRVTTAALVGFAVSFAFLLMRLSESSGIYAIFQTLMAFFQGPAFAILLIGILWKRATGTAALIALLCGIATSVFLFTVNQPAVYEALGWQPLFRIQEPFLYFSVWAFLVTAVLLLAISLVTKPEPPEKLAYVLGQENPRMTPLHHFGDAVRTAMTAIPLPAVRGLFLVTLLALLIWVLRLPARRPPRPGGAKRWDENLKVAAAFALLMQLAIYAIL